MKFNNTKEKTWKVKKRNVSINNCRFKSERAEVKFDKILIPFLSIVERQWLWAFPQIEGVPPSPRGGHSATLTGASLVIFGVS